LNGHHGVDVRLAVHNLTGGRHLGRHGVAGIDVCRGSAAGVVETVKLSIAPIEARIAP
jgi:hypothetical protein